MYLGNQLNSIWDEKSLGDTEFRSSLYKIQTMYTTYGNMSNTDHKDYYSINPGLGVFSLYVTSDPKNNFTNSSFNYEFDVKITNNIGETTLNTHSSDSDNYTDSITFASYDNSTYYVEITNSFFSKFDYAATLLPGRLRGPSQVFTSRGSDSDDVLSAGYAQDIEIFGYGGNDHIYVGSGTTKAIGGEGIDALYLPGTRLAYTSVAGSIVSDGATTFSTTGLTGPGVVKVEHQGIERLHFIDGELRTDKADIAAQVYRLYNATLDRVPDSGGLKNWVVALESGSLTLQQAAYGFTSSSEFDDKYGCLCYRHNTNAGFVDLLYRNVLGRDPDLGGLQNWVNAMTNGMSRSEVVVSFSEAPEHIELTRSVVEKGIWVRDDQAVMVARLYDTVLDRLPDAQGLTSWVTAIKGGMTSQQAANGFTGSQEFQQKYGSLDDTAFVQQLYRNVLDREGEAGGVEAWKNALQGIPDMTRADVVLGFSESPEHQNKLAPYIDDGIWFV